jgi:hypothetical protein
MRLAAIAIAVPVAALGLLVLSNTLLLPPPAADRLAGVTVSVPSYRIEEPVGSAPGRLHVTVNVTSARDLDECLAFALDQQFAGRRLTVADSTCVRPRAGSMVAQLVFERLSTVDLDFPSHTLVWGVAGGRCGMILEAFGVCVVDVAGTTPVELPVRTWLPSFPPLGPISPIFSFEPIP